MSHPSRFIHHAVEFSYYSGKTRSYLLHKGIPFEERNPKAWGYLLTLPIKVGAAVVPVLQTPEGSWLQDTSCIIDAMEQRFPQRPMLPAGPVQRLAAYLFELWGDEFLLMMAMHTRWNRPEHHDWYAAHAGAVLLPGWPSPMQRWLGGRIGSQMSGFAATLGFDATQRERLDRFTQIQLDALDAHFARHAFLFGGRPSLGDFGLIGPLFAHVGRDPLSRRDLIDPRPALKAWIARMFDPASAVDGEFLADDSLPETLLPALRSIFDEMLPFIAACGQALGSNRKTAAGRTLRFFDRVEFPLAGGLHRRSAASYPVWMAQRLLDALASWPEAEQRVARAWLAQVGGEQLLALKLPRMARQGLAARVLTPAGAGRHAG
ncbi:glutathione S-transferase family protein [Paucibacter soli]|uniref:glutathione S-transferase family protein n=1 Tax=Paucibacter soli TaxID=3133433 RepID=UPI0030ACDC0D